MVFIGKNQKTLTGDRNISVMLFVFVFISRRLLVNRMRPPRMVNDKFLDGVGVYFITYYHKACSFCCAIPPHWYNRCFSLRSCLKKAVGSGRKCANIGSKENRLVALIWTYHLGYIIVALPYLQECECRGQRLALILNLIEHLWGRWPVRRLWQASAVLSLDWQSRTWIR